MLVGLITFFLLLILTQYLAYQRYLIDRDNESEEVQQELHSVKDRLETALNHSRSAIKTLAFIVKKDGVLKDFDAIAIDILESNKVIDALELAQGGIVTHVYPLRGNEQNLGFNILTDPLRRVEAYRAIERKELLFSGPSELGQAGAIAGRLPIFIDDKFWGFSIVLIKLPTLLSAAGINAQDNSKFIYQLSKQSNVTGQEEFFLPTPKIFTDNQVAPLLVPDGQWKIYVASKARDGFPFTFAFFIIGVFLSITGGLFARNLVKRPENPENLVKERTSQLLTSQNKRSKDVTEKLKATEEIKHSYKKMQELTAHLQHVREDERTRIAREIHDELGQQLTGLKMDASWISKKMNPIDTVIHQKVANMLCLIDDMVKTVRRISSDLRPGILDDLGLIPALEWNGQEFEKRTGIKSTFRTSFPNFNPERNCATHIFRIHQEALTNIARHAQATEIETSLEEINGYINLTVKDNGIGFDIEQVKTKKSWGLVGMKERALLFHGELSVESKKQSGTLITLKVAVGDLEVTE